MIKSVAKVYDEDSVWVKSYTLTYTDGKVCDVPHELANRHFIAIQEWVAEGNTIEEAD